MILVGKVKDILNKYSGNALYGDLSQKFVDSAESPELIVPVIGMQGMGKSTLLNAIIGENILPNEADETTCVPVEIRFGEETRIEVHFTSKPFELLNEHKDLKLYVDNNYNPGNQLGVSHIVVVKKHRFLESGLVLVDLPGVGSLTKNNQETTMRYIKNLCFAIMIIPTVPTIRRMEEIFIKSVWKAFSKVIFVQNIFGESKREVMESIDFNQKVLSDIGQQINISEIDPIIAVNAYDAAYGIIHKHNDMYEKSNLNGLLNHLDSYTSDRREILLAYAKQHIGEFITEIKTKINKLIEENQMSIDELQRSLDENELEFKQSTEKIELEVEELQLLLKKTSREIKTFSMRIAREQKENLRVGIYHVIDCGVVDGDQLTQAFVDIQNGCVNDAIEQTFDKMDGVMTEIRNKLEEINLLISRESEANYESMIFNNSEAFKFEKGLDIGIKLVGAGGGIWVGAAVGGAIGGPIGVAVGILAMLSVSAISSFLGSTTKKEIVKARARTTKSEIEPYIESFYNTIRAVILDNYKSIEADVTNVMDEYLNSRKEYINSLKAENAQKIQRAYNETESDLRLKELKFDLESLKKAEGEKLWD
ncbi:Dynamin family protein [Anaerovirgula multivorans]|uniref:Dynamin family protein n=1 Tax=Anaerovirgula multivorans TaxID=312168 RepID=A0A239GLE3_9FIRM|nr:dynamin family protein [Anaerovirgula multivorans]SNS70096.1 Dynamin family protein [Anaerovirgula multivorans]